MALMIKDFAGRTSSTNARTTTIRNSSKFRQHSELIRSAMEHALVGAHAQPKLRQIGRTLYGDGQAAMRILADLAAEAPAIAQAPAS